MRICLSVHVDVRKEAVQEVDGEHAYQKKKVGITQTYHRLRSTEEVDESHEDHDAGGFVRLIDDHEVGIFFDAVENIDQTFVDDDF